MTVVAQFQQTVLCFVLAAFLPLYVNDGQDEEEKIQPPFMLDLELGMRTTLLLAPKKGPPPWPHGNIATIGNWTLVNMHAENLSEFRKKSGIGSLQVQPLDQTHVLVIDDRVGKEWLRCSPFGSPLGKQLRWLNHYRQHFRASAAEKALLDSDWELIDEAARPDIVRVILPHDRLQFQEGSLTCEKISADSTTNAKVERGWLIQEYEQSPPFLTIIDMNKSTEECSAIRCYMEIVDDELTLTPLEKIESNADGTSGLTLDGSDAQPQRFRRVARR